jgi:hypothetical protein
MECPACGYDGIAEEALFCPHCRHKFQELEFDEMFESPPVYEPEQPEEHGVSGDLFVENQVRQIQVQLLQPAILVMLSTAAVLYLASGRIADLAVTVAAYEIRYGGFLCLLAGAIVGWIFYRIVLLRIR